MEGGLNEAGDVLYYAQALHGWQPQPGKVGLSLEISPVPSVVAVVEECANGWLRGFLVGPHDEHEILPFPAGHVKQVRLKAKPALAPVPPEEDAEDTDQPRDMDAASTESLSASSQLTEEQDGLLDVSAHDVSYHAHLEAFEKALAADRPPRLSQNSITASQEQTAAAGSTDLQPDGAADHARRESQPSTQTSPQGASGQGSASATSQPDGAMVSGSHLVDNGVADAAADVQGSTVEHDVVNDQEELGTADEREGIAALAERAKQEREQREQEHMRNAEKATSAWRAKRDAATAEANQQDQTQEKESEKEDDEDDEEQQGEQEQEQEQEQQQDDDDDEEDDDDNDEGDTEDNQSMEAVPIRQE
eukprot:COSAG02_NODE_9259_length_2275_cov_205.301930_1_plen_362_part_10